MLLEQNSLTGDNPAMMVANDGQFIGDGGSGPHAPPPPHCDCSLEIVDATSPVPTWGSGGFLGYEFVVDYFPTNLQSLTCDYDTVFILLKQGNYGEM